MKVKVKPVGGIPLSDIPAGHVGKSVNADSGKFYVLRVEDGGVILTYGYCRRHIDWFTDGYIDCGLLEIVEE